MTNCDFTRLYPALGRLLSYPDESLWQAADEAVASAGRFAGTLQGFQEAARAEGLDAFGEIYTRTFDVAPSCVPYVSVHLFGEENFKRGEFMARLARRYKDAAFPTNGELPDHLALLLRFSPNFEKAEWEDLVVYCLKKPVAKMRDTLKAAGNPYRFPLQALSAILAADAEREVSHV